VNTGIVPVITPNTKTPEGTMTRVLDLLQSVQVTEPQDVGNLQVFGLRWTGGDGLRYATLDEALAAGALEVTEASEGGSVPTLQVANKSDTMVFLMAGEQLIGAKQNRVLNASIMVAGHTVLPIPVSCVEAGRWAYRSRCFGSHGTSSHALLRHKMSKQVTKSYRDAGRPSSDQGEVWNEVSRKLGAMGSHSATVALDQCYEDTRVRLDDMLGQVRVPEGCCGAVFAVGGQIAGVDLFDKSETLGKLWPKLLRAYAIDALETPLSAEARVTSEAVRAWLNTANTAKVEPFPSPGLGQDIRLEAPTLVGASLVVEEQPVHVELFAEQAPPPATQPA
jgi:hypothetical protein